LAKPRLVISNAMLKQLLGPAKPESLMKKQLEEEQ
jgi:hypothetical protein